MYAFVDLVSNVHVDCQLQWGLLSFVQRTHAIEKWSMTRIWVEEGNLHKGTNMISKSMIEDGALRTVVICLKLVQLVKTSIILHACYNSGHE